MSEESQNKRIDEILRKAFEISPADISDFLDADFNKIHFEKIIDQETMDITTRIISTSFTTGPADITRLPTSILLKAAVSPVCVIKNVQSRFIMIEIRYRLI